MKKREQFILDEQEILTLIFKMGGIFNDHDFKVVTMVPLSFGPPTGYTLEVTVEKKEDAPQT